MSRFLLHDNAKPDVSGLSTTQQYLYSRDGKLYIIDDNDVERELLPAPGSLSNGDLIYYNGTSWVRLAVGSNGQVLQSNGTIPGWTSLSATNAGIVHFGNNSITSSTTTRYLTPGYDQSTALTAVTQWDAPRAGTMQNMYVRHNSAGGNANAVVYTLRVNGVASALTVSLAANGTVASDLVNTVAISQGDQLDIEVTKALGVGSTPNRIMCSMEFS